jgi:carboxypeptidase C (cathepsin A)
LLFLFTQLSFAQQAPPQRQPPSQTPQTTAPAATPTPTPVSDEPPVITKHEIKLDERVVKYTVTTGMMPIKNQVSGETEARMFFMAYTLDGVSDPSKRPLMFSFNGGPGSSSVWLATPYFAAEYTVDQMDLDPSLKSNIKTAYYEAGHMMYIDVKSLAKLKQDVAAFIQSSISGK